LVYLNVPRSTINFVGAGIGSDEKKRWENIQNKKSKDWVQPLKRTKD
jgi:hypothetical protein